EDLEDAVTLAGSPIVTFGSDRGHVQRRMGFLQRLRKNSEIIDSGEAPLVAKLLRLPGFSNDLYALLQPCSAFVLLNSEAIVFEAEQAPADPELQSSTGQNIDKSEILREAHWTIEWNQAHRGTEPDRSCPLSQGGK